MSSANALDSVKSEMWPSGTELTENLISFGRIHETVLENSQSYFPAFSSFESNTNSDWLNHLGLANHKEDLVEIKGFKVLKCVFVEQK